MSAQMEVTFNCEALINAVNMIMDPESTVEQRTQAQQFCDEFKEKSQYCVSCGLKLAEITEPTVVRRLGLQLIEYVAKNRWNKISADEKTFMKNRVMNLIAVGTKPVLEEETCIKDAIVRIVVEIAKHSWPEHWPKMLSEMQALSQKGGLYAELILLILLRLSEDATTLRLLPSGRGDIIKRNLNQSTPVVLAIVHGLLNEHLKMYKLLRNDPKQQYKFRTYCRVITAALFTMQEYFDWISVSYIKEKNFAILENVWRLFNESTLKVEAADCLLVALNRSLAGTGAKPLLVQFAVLSTPLLLSPVQTTPGEVLSEENYLFLKRRCELLCLFGQQLCRMDFHSSVAAPPNLDRYLNALHTFTTHSSQYLSCQTQSVWRALFNHRKLSRNVLLLEKLPIYLLATRTNLVKVGFPSKTNSPSCDYSRLDFANDEDFYEFLTTYREEQKQTIDAACRLDQKTCFQKVAECLKYQLTTSSVDSDPKNSEKADSTTGTSPHSFIQWEAITFFTNIIVTNLFKNLKTKDIPVKNGIELLEQLLNYKTKDPHILACVQTNLSTLFPFLNIKNDCLPRVLSRLLEIIEEVQAPTTPSLKHARKYACNCINKMCRDNAAIILPNFETLFKCVKRLLCDEQLQLSATEKSKLVEAMVVLINHLPDYKKQKECLDVLIAPVAEFWLSKEMERVFADPEAFITYIGADLPMTDLTENPTDLNRSKILYCVGTIYGLLRWVHCPSDLEKAKAGGFVDGVMSNGKPFCRNPCAVEVLKLLDNLLLLVRTQLNLFLPALVSKMGTTFEEALNQYDDLHHYLLDVCDPPQCKSALQQMQAFLCLLFDNCLYILGRAGPAFKRDFFTIKDLGNKILSSACVNLDNLPQHRYLPIFRVFLRPFVKSCPEEYIESYVCPILGPLLTIFHAKLPHKWHTIDPSEHIPKMQITFKNQKLPELPNPDPGTWKLKQIGPLTKEVLTFLLEVCSVHEGDTIVITDERTERKAKHDTRKRRETHDRRKRRETHDDRHKKRDASRKDATTVSAKTKDASRKKAHTASSKTDDVHFVSKKDPDVICTAESDDDEDEVCVCIEDDINSTTAEHNVCLPEESAEMSDDSDDACYVATEEADASVNVADESDGSDGSDDACYVATEEADASVIVADESDGSDDACAVVSDEADCSAEAVDPDDRYSFNNESADTSVACSDSDGETAAEVPQTSRLVSREVAGYLKYSPLSKLGTCLMRDEDIRYTLLRIVFSCLGYKAYYCCDISTRLCWPMLKEVINEPLTTELVTDLFAAIFDAFPKKTHNKLSMNALLQLAFHVYESLRPRYMELKDMMTQVPKVNPFYLYQFDERLVNPKIGKPDHALLILFHRLLGAVSRVSETFHEKSRKHDAAFPSKKSRKRSLEKNLTLPFKKPKLYHPAKNAYSAFQDPNVPPRPYKKPKNPPPPFKYSSSGPPPYKKPKNPPPPFKYSNSEPPSFKKPRNAPPYFQNPNNPSRPYRKPRRGKQGRYL